MEIDRPIFIIGSGRSGTTIFSDLLCFHPQLAWFSSFTNFFPFLPSLATLSRIYNLTSLRRLKKYKLAPSPSEAWNIWKKCCSKDFLYKPLNENDVTHKARSCLKKMITKHLKYQGKTRFITKLTGPPKIRYLNEMFPDSMFIYIIRDGRAVVNSLLNVRFWKEKGGYEKPWWDGLPKEFREEWIKANKSSLVLAAVQWKYLIQLYLEEREYVEQNRCLEIRYEEFIENPVDIMKKVTNFCHLDLNEAFEKHIKSIKLKNMNYKWKENFSDTEQQILNSSLKNHLKKINYI